MGISILYMTMCTISKDIGINKEKWICLSKKEHISGDGSERTNMVTKCEIFMSYSKICMDVCKRKTNMTAK